MLETAWQLCQTIVYTFKELLFGFSESPQDPLCVLIVMKHAIEYWHYAVIVKSTEVRPKENIISDRAFGEGSIYLLRRHF